jgi:hypothetical protein
MTDVEAVFAAGSLMALPAIIGVLHQIRMDTKAEARAAKAETDRLALSVKVEDVKKATDGLTDKLVAAAKIEGQQAEVARAKAESDSNAAAVAKATSGP